MFDREQYELRIVERNLARAKRNEFQLIVQRCNQIGFNYVVLKLKPARICFGSSIEREVLPCKGKSLNSFIGRITGQQTSTVVSPAHYDLNKQNAIDQLLNKKVNITGFGSIAFRLPRFRRVGFEKAKKDVPVEARRFQCYKPFGKSMKEPKIMESLTPGPGTYKQFQKKRMEKHSFGGKIKIIPSVLVLCTPINLSKCNICNKAPNGDYWRNFNNNLDICRMCMSKSRYNINNNVKNISKKLKQLNELNEYESVRHCDFYHNHGKMTAAVRVLTYKELSHKIKYENYLAKYNI